MKLGLILSDWKRTEDTLERVTADKLGVVLAENGVYHAVLKEGGQTSPVLAKEGADFYVMTPDLETRGFTTDQIVDSKIKAISYGDLVDLIMNDYDKFGWL